MIPLHKLAIVFDYKLLEDIFIILSSCPFWKSWIAKIVPDWYLHLNL